MYEEDLRSDHRKKMDKETGNQNRTHTLTLRGSPKGGCRKDTDADSSDGGGQNPRGEKTENRNCFPGSKILKAKDKQNISKAATVDGRYL
jgi:hypothetical protein